LIAELETRVEQLKASEVDMKNLFYRVKEAREVLEYDYKQLAYECDKHMELRIASDRDLVNCYKSMQKLNEDCEKLRSQLKELEEAALPIARLLVPHPGGPKIAPLVDRLREAPSRLATYVKHLAKSIPNQILAYMKSYFPKAPVDVVAGELAANCTVEQYAELLEQMAPIVGVLDRQTYQGGTRDSRLCGGDRDREIENSKVRARTRDTRFIQVRAAKVANPTSCLGDQV
jgi:hypothetical protein